MKWDSVFGSEHPGKAGDAPRRFLALNTAPRVMFKDMTARGRSGHDSNTRLPVPTPGCDLYTAGWVCKAVRSITCRGQCLSTYYKCCAVVLGLASDLRCLKLCRAIFVIP
eukprot:16389555-Heterocapsa_arctica.AAC.1